MNALTLSLVAVLENHTIGNVVFSPAMLSDGSGPWFALGPVSVLPQYQKQSVGSALINKGLESIKQLGARGCILTGNPDYYQRFGFKLSPDNVPVRESPEYFMVKTFSDNMPLGHFKFHDAFYEAT
ncbi:MAG: N-acetyltransferase [Gammaproteobacteria bacterium]|nr:N-acetyltransferase [Gammaproteobacteria bacterium]